MIDVELSSAVWLQHIMRFVFSGALFQFSSFLLLHCSRLSLRWLPLKYQSKSIRLTICMLFPNPTTAMMATGSFTMNDFGSSVVVSWTTTPVAINYTLAQLRVPTNPLLLLLPICQPTTTTTNILILLTHHTTPHHTNLSSLLSLSLSLSLHTNTDTTQMYQHTNTNKLTNRMLSGWNETTCALECNIVADIMFLSYFPPSLSLSLCLCLSVCLSVFHHHHLGV